MIKCILFTVLLSILLWNGVDAKTRCFSVSGKLICRSNSTRHMDTEIYLMDDDGKVHFSELWMGILDVLPGYVALEGTSQIEHVSLQQYLKLWH